MAKQQKRVISRFGFVFLLHSPTFRSFSQLRSENAKLKEKLAALEKSEKKLRSPVPRLSVFGQRVLEKCRLDKLAAPVAACRDDEAVCWKNRALKLERDVLVKAIRTSMCMTTAPRCRPNPMTRSEQS